MGHVRNEIIRWTGRLGFRPVALLMGGVSMLLVPQLCHAQGLVPTPGASTGVASAALLEPNMAFEDRWELFLSGRLGFPTGTYYFLDGSTTIRGASVVSNGFRTRLP